ncbi:MAG: TRAP transporter small permease [Lautropia sp.]
MPGDAAAPHAAGASLLGRINDAIARAFLLFAALLAFLLSFLVVADVIGRVVFNSPVKGTPEIVSTAIVIVCFLQAGFAIRSGGMLNVDVFVLALPTRPRQALLAVGAVCGVVFFGFLCWGSVEPAVHAFVSNEFEGEGALRVPSWPARFALLVGSALAASSYLLSAIDHGRRALAGDGARGASGG